jgi:hypothetical protein
VRRYDWPGLDGFNFLLESALGGGGTASLRQDPQGKSYAQLLMDFPVNVPEDWILPGGLLSSWPRGVAVECEAAHAKLHGN